MDDKIYLRAKEINEELNKNEDVILLNKLEKEMNDSYEVFCLSKKKDECLEKYLANKDMYGEDNELTISSLKELSAAKEELQNHPLVKSYLEVYSKVRDLYLEIDDILLSSFKKVNKICQ